MDDKTVSQVVTDRVLKMDRDACDTLLNTFLNEKIENDAKKSIIKTERQIVRTKLAEKHNATLMS